MERQRFLPLLAVIIFIWVLWRYEAALALLGFFCNLIMPFIIGGCPAFFLNVPLVHIERLWQKLFARFSSDWPQKIKRPVCLIFTLTLIIGIVLIGGLKIGPDLHQSFNMIVKTLPKASAELTVSLKERWSELALSPDTLDYLQSQWSELLRAVDSYWENNKTTLFYNTLNITTSLISLVSNIVIGVVFAVYLLLNKETISRQTRNMILAFCSGKRAAYLLDLGSAAHTIFSGYIGGQPLPTFFLGVWIIMPRRDAAFRAAICSVNFGHRWLSGYYPDHRHYHQRPFRSYSYWARRPRQNLAVYSFLLRTAAYRRRYPLS